MAIWDDIGKGIQAIQKALEKVLKDIAGLAKKVAGDIAGVPQKIVAFMRDTAGPRVVAIGTRAAATAEAAYQAVDSSVQFVQTLVDRCGRWDEKAFRKRLDKFFDDALALLGEVPRIIADIEIRTEPEAEFLKTILRFTPGVVLFGASLALEALPGWHTAPGNLLMVAKQVPPIHEANPELCRTLLPDNPNDPRAKLHHDISSARAVARLVSKTLAVAIALVPKDLSVHVSVLGEGGGTEVAGHPARWPFETVKWVVDLADQAFAQYLDVYGACAQSRWRDDVTDRLKRIEAAIGA